MAEPDPAGQQPQGRQVDPGRLIAAMTEQLGQQQQQILALSVALAQADEEAAALRAELVAATSGGRAAESGRAGRKSSG